MAWLMADNYWQRIKENPRSVFDYLQGNLFYKLRQSLPDYILNSSIIATSIEEQVEYRKWLCDDCIFAKECLFCGCETPQKFYQWFPCSGERWEAFQLPSKWISNPNREIFLEDKEQNGKN